MSTATTTTIKLRNNWGSYREIATVLTYDPATYTAQVIYADGRTGEVYSHELEAIDGNRRLHPVHDELIGAHEPTVVITLFGPQDVPIGGAAWATEELRPPIPVISAPTVAAAAISRRVVVDWAMVAS